MIIKEISLGILLIYLIIWVIKQKVLKIDVKTSLTFILSAWFVINAITLLNELGLIESFQFIIMNRLSEAFVLSVFIFIALTLGDMIKGNPLSLSLFKNIGIITLIIIVDFFIISSLSCYIKESQEISTIHLDYKHLSFINYMSISVVVFNVFVLFLSIPDDFLILKCGEFFIFVSKFVCFSAKVNNISIDLRLSNGDNILTTALFIIGIIFIMISGIKESYKLKGLHKIRAPLSLN